jgi:kynurenine formamidase
VPAIRKQLIDLSHTIEEGLITYQGLPAPSIGEFLSRQDSRKLYSEGTEFQIGKIEMVANTGTYLDSPFHRFAEGADLADLHLEQLADLPGVVLRHDSSRGRAFKISREELSNVKEKAVLIHTGWARHWNTPAYFTGHPYLTKGSALALRDGGAILVGIDSLNIDDTGDGARPAHTILLQAGIPIVEHLTRLHLLPDQGFRFFATPVKIRALGSFPVRAFALVGSDR